MRVEGGSVPEKVKLSIKPTACALHRLKPSVQADNPTEMAHGFGSGIGPNANTDIQYDRKELCEKHLKFVLLHSSLIWKKNVMK